MNINNLYQKKSLLNTPFNYFNTEKPNFSAFEITSNSYINKNKNRNGLLATPPLDNNFPFQQRNISSSRSYFPIANKNLEANRDKLNINNAYTKNLGDGLLPLPDEIVTNETNFTNEFSSNQHLDNQQKSISTKRSRFSDTIPKPHIVNQFEDSNRKMDQKDFNNKYKHVKKSRFQDSVDVESDRINKNNHSNSLHKGNLDINDVFESSIIKLESKDKDSFKTSSNDSKFKYPSNSDYESKKNIFYKSKFGSNLNKISDDFYQPHKQDNLKLSNDEYNKTDDIFKDTINLVRGRIRYHVPQKGHKIINDEKNDVDKPNEIFTWQTLINKPKNNIFNNEHNNFLDNYQNKFSLQDLVNETEVITNDKCSLYSKDFIPGICEDVNIKETSANINLNNNADITNDKLLLDQKIRLFELFKKCKKRASSQSTVDQLNFNETSANDCINNECYENKDILLTENTKFSSIPSDNMTTENLNSLSLDEIIFLYNETLNNIFKPNSDIKLSENDIKILQSIQDTFNNTKLSTKDNSTNTLKKISNKLDSYISEKGLFDKKTQLMTGAKKDKRQLNYHNFMSRDLKNSKMDQNKNSKQYLKKNNRNKNRNTWDKQYFNIRNDSRRNDRFDKAYKDKGSADDGLLENPYILENNMTKKLMNPILNVNPLNSILINNQVNMLQTNLTLQLLATNLQKNILNANITKNKLRKY